ncbi:hypothetical protein CAOG_08674 [Capsaspora owczarzaki ATCC 30864]|uniref:hypothetical protein n=1 Tax=Capsaspora owczarzaki (strain ATCC 30864) TaxID=595528 RepID=UPI00035232E6|nr:hypothetical protein CAOG_08674 [Capsaspora owczarzaki ATCC 30864]|eukprot:XP_011270285.1 hypothetical protein CAOG_08674 [Capsaspora owczarzaki ATCC 30864]
MHKKLEAWMIDRLATRSCEEVLLEFVRHVSTAPRPKPSWEVLMESTRWFPSDAAVKTFLVRALKGGASPDAVRLHELATNLQSTSASCQHNHAPVGYTSCSGSAFNHGDVLFYQPQSCSCPSPAKGRKVCHDLNERVPLIIVVCTPCQHAIWHRLRPKIVCMDSTGGVSTVGVTATAIVAPNQFGRGVPLAFMISSKQTNYEYEVFLSTLQNTLGSAFRPERIVVDKCDAERNAIKTVFPEAKVGLCIFHVYQAVRRHLVQHLKAKDDKALIKQVLAQLHYVQRAANEDEVQAAIATTLQMVQHNKKVLEYLRVHWMTRGELEQWSIAYLGQDRDTLMPVHTNNFVERFFHSLKYKWFRGLRNRDATSLLQTFTHHINAYYCTKTQKGSWQMNRAVRAKVQKDEVIAKRMNDTGKVLPLDKDLGLAVVIALNQDIPQELEAAVDEIRTGWELSDSDEMLDEITAKLAEIKARCCVVALHSRFCSAGHLGGMICVHIRAAAQHFGDLAMFGMDSPYALVSGAPSMSVPLTTYGVACDLPEESGHESHLDDDNGQPVGAQEQEQAADPELWTICTELESLRKRLNDAEFEKRIAIITKMMYNVRDSQPTQRAYRSMFSNRTLAQSKRQAAASRAAGASQGHTPQLVSRAGRIHPSTHTPGLVFTTANARLRELQKSCEQDPTPQGFEKAVQDLRPSRGQVMAAQAALVAEAAVPRAARQLFESLAAERAEISQRMRPPTRAASQSQQPRRYAGLDADEDGADDDDEDAEENDGELDWGDRALASNARGAASVKRRAAPNRTAKWCKRPRTTRRKRSGRALNDDAQDETSDWDEAASQPSIFSQGERASTMADEDAS